MAFKWVQTIAVPLIAGFAMVQSLHIDMRTFGSDGAIFDVGRYYITKHEKVLKQLDKTYEKEPALKVAKILSQAEDRDAKIGQFTIEQLFNLNRLAVSDCFAGELESRQSICAQITHNNLQKYCQVCVEKLEQVCKSASTSALVETALTESWPHFHDMLTVSGQVARYIMSTGDEEESDVKNIVDFCRSDGVNVNGLRSVCDKVYGQLKTKVFPIRDEKLIIEYLDVKYSRKFHKNVPQALERCRIILEKCEIGKSGILSCLDWLKPKN